MVFIPALKSPFLLWKAQSFLEYSTILPFSDALVLLVLYMIQNSFMFSIAFFYDVSNTDTQDGSLNHFHWILSAPLL